MTSAPPAVVAGVVPPGTAPATRRGMHLRGVVAFAAVAGAFSYSLTTLLRGLTLQTPLAYLGLVPVLAAVLVLAKRRPRLDEPEIHDRELDWIVGAPLLGIALLIVLLLPDQLSTRFWEQRVDLLALPFFTAGVIALLFGVRTLWRVRVAIAFLLLAWPAPWGWWLDTAVETTASLTLAALRAVHQLHGWATPVDGSDGSLFRIGSGASAFEVSVASPCSGVNSLVGFALAGGAFLTLVRGSKRGKLLWLFAGLALTWLLNVARILLIFFAGDRMGEGAAIGTLHPFLGLVTFSVGVLLMILVMPRFGIGPAPKPPLEVVAAVRSRRPPVPRARLATAVVAAVAITLAVANAGFARYELVAGDLGAARLAPFTGAPTAVDGWSAREIDRYDWARPYFGGDSSWIRYAYSSGSPGDPALIADVVLTSDLRSFSTYGLKACYRFHKFEIAADGEVDLPGGIRAEWLSYHHPKLGADWTVLAWIWPVRTDDGTRYERIVLMTPGDAGTVDALRDFAEQIVVSQPAAPIDPEGE